MIIDIRWSTNIWSGGQCKVQGSGAGAAFELTCVFEIGRQLHIKLLCWLKVSRVYFFKWFKISFKILIKFQPIKSMWKTTALAFKSFAELIDVYLLKRYLSFTSNALNVETSISPVLAALEPLQPCLSTHFISSSWHSLFVKGLVSRFNFISDFLGDGKFWTGLGNRIIRP